MSQVGMHEARTRLLRGSWRGQIHIADDFDELPGDIAEACGMR